MADVPSEKADAPPEETGNASPKKAGAITPVEIGTLRWYDATKKMGVINRADGSTIFFPPYGIAEGQRSMFFGQRVSFIQRQNAKGPYAAEVSVINSSAPSSEIVQEIAEALNEDVPQALAQIRRILRHLGPKFAWHYVAEAKRVEAEGGLMLPDGSRRRTLGGVFFFLLRGSLNDEQRTVIFPPVFVRKVKQPRPQAPPEPPPAPPLAWAERMDLLATLLPESGKATTVKVTVIGRPSKIEERPQVTLLTLVHAGALPALPKGIPVPNPVPATTYSIYIGKKQWKNVAEAIKDPEDLLIIEGMQVLDAASGTIAVFATKTTTKLIQQASRRPKQPAPGEAGDAAPAAEAE